MAVKMLWGLFWAQGAEKQKEQSRELGCGLAAPLRIYSPKGGYYVQTSHKRKAQSLSEEVEGGNS